MHNIEPYSRWINLYQSSQDEHSPFYGRQYNNDLLDKKIYNYFIHPQWDGFGSNTLYAKILFADYEDSYAIIELLGEWNDCLYNDIMYLKRDLVDAMIYKGIHTFIVFCDNVLNYHASDNSYYEEWWDDVKDEDGRIIFLNTRKHIWEEMESIQVQYYCQFGEHYNDFEWRNKLPKNVISAVLDLQQGETKQLS